MSEAMERRLETLKDAMGRGDLRWWTSEKAEAHEAFLRWCDMVRNRHTTIERRKQMLLYASLYANYPVLGFGLNTYTRQHTRSVAMTAGNAANRIVLNATANAIDALVAKMTKNRPHPTFTTDDADWEMKDKAEKKGRFVDGQLHAGRFYKKATGVILDAAIQGLGSVKAYMDMDKMDVGIDRVYPWEHILDDREALYGEPQCRGQRKHYDRQVVRELFAREDPKDDAEAVERKEAIRQALDAASRDIDPEDFDYDDTTDQILVYEGWHLKSGKNAKDGRHIIAIRGATLLYEEYDEDSFPFVDIRPLPAQFGFWGVGVCEKVIGIQTEINRIVRDIQAAMHLIAKPHWMVESSSKVTLAHLDNDLATIVKYAGGIPPTVYVPQAMSAEVYTHLQFLYRSIYEITGVSQLSAQSQLPAGLDGASGTALRTYLNNESERFTDFVQAYEDMVGEVAEKMVQVARQIAEKNKNYAVRAIGKGGFEDMKWADVDLGDKYEIQVFPTSLLPQTPAGKLAFVEQMTANNYLEVDEALELIDWPDTEAFMKRRTAARRIIERNISAMKKGIPVSPEPLDNHKLALVLVNQAYHEARLDGLPDERLELFREYMTLTEYYAKQAEPPPPPPQLPQGNPQAMPQGAPPAPPPVAAPPMAAGAPPGAPIQ